MKIYAKSLFLGGANNTDEYQCIVFEKDTIIGQPDLKELIIDIIMIHE